MAAGEQTPFQEIVDHEPFCQGDILHSSDGENGGLGSFGVIITADCDIAQRKDGGEFSILSIISAERYIREVWAVLECQKLANRQMATALQILNGAIARTDPRLEQLTPLSLLSWLSNQEPGDILDAVGITAKSARNEAERALGCLRDSQPSHRGEPPIDALKRVWARLNISEKAIRSRLSDVLDPTRGPPDMYFVPYLPEFSEIGFVVQLRHLASIHRDSVFSSRLDARIRDRPVSFYRIGRFRDGVKYSIVQRVVNLFSRVGLSEEYEAESSYAADIVVEMIQSQISGAMS